MTRNHSGTVRLRAAPDSPWWASSTALSGLLGPLNLLSLLSLLIVCGSANTASADSGRPRLGWSTAPRWRLPPVRRPDCPEGQVLTLSQVRKARCVETG
ncbi:MAG: hypothetical protein H0T76_23100, partial [Nannocystis sp.]